MTQPPGPMRPTTNPPEATPGGGRGDARSRVPSLPQQPGSARMPRWTIGTLPQPPIVSFRTWAAMLGPGIVMAGSAIGAGEWLLGPAVSARYGGALLWVTTLSLLGQLVYNLEVSRYTLYTGEPIVTGKFRTWPGPLVWLGAYLLLDFGAILPYQVSHAATAAASLWRGAVPNPDAVAADAQLLHGLSYVMLVAALVPLVFGGKVYASLKAIMTVKIAVVLGFLLVLALGYSSLRTWQEIAIGFVQVGNVPLADGSVANVFTSWWRGEGLPPIDHTSLPLLTTFAAIAGVGGLAQTTISNYTRDQGWGMGAHVGAIPSMVGGRHIQLSHVGCVFRIDDGALHRWRAWRRHVLRDQMVVWLPAALVGIALPSMLSIEFLPRGTEASQWTLVAMSAGGVEARVGGTLGTVFWYGVLVCGFLVLLPNAAANADGFIRRWIDACWTALESLRRLETSRIRVLYFAMVVAYLAVGFFFLSISRPMWLIVAYGNLGNLALAVSCWHALVVNVTLLPRELRPGWGARLALALAGGYFFLLAALTAWALVQPAAA
jgi:hypothetical protein